MRKLSAIARRTSRHPPRPRCRIRLPPRIPRAGRKIAGGRKSLLQDIAFRIEREDALESFGRTHLAAVRVRTSMPPPAKSQCASAATPRSSQHAPGTQSKSMNAKISPTEAAAPPLRAGPAPSGAPDQTRPAADDFRHRILALWRAIVRHDDLGVLGGKSLTRQRRQAQIQRCQIIIMRYDYADFHHRPACTRPVCEWSENRDMVTWPRHRAILNSPRTRHSSLGTRNHANHL